MDKQHLHLVEAAQDDLVEILRADNPSVSAEIGFDSEEKLIRIAIMPAGIPAVEEVPETSTGNHAETAEPKLTPEDEARIDRLAETYHNYGDAYRQVMQEMRNRAA
ncbi:MAG TPA: hypothetical protein VHB72_02770 [Candidatus Saccharimonadales bacterium]|nr:hypothetical protein [Candidatus Saccharimonadales bacterium]